MTEVHPHMRGEHIAVNDPVVGFGGSSPQCGEHFAKLGGNPIDNGSSPRVWGIHLSESRSMPNTRIIPTHVGNTNAEKKPAIRFIPTHVGNTRSVVPTIQVITVHPHACGELMPAASM